MANMQQIADALGITRTHVARALNNSGYVKESLRVKILKTAKRLNYRPNRSAVALAARRTMTVGLFSGVDPVYFNAFSPLPEMTHHLSDALDQLGYSLRVMPGHAASVERMDGAICAFTAGVEMFRAAARGRSLPAVAMLRLMPGQTAPGGMASVTYDRAPALASLAAMCRQKGMRRIGVLSARMSGAQAGAPEIFDAFEREGLAVARPDALLVERQPESLVRQILDLMPRIRKMDLCVLRSEAVAFPFYQAACVAGLRIPQDLSVAAVSHASFSVSMSPPLSAIEFSLEEFCAQVAQSMASAIAGQPFERSKVVEAQFINRQSIR